MRPAGTKVELERRRRLGLALHLKGMTIREVAATVGCAPGSVARWAKMAREGGDNALDPIPGPGGKSRMTDADRERLRAILLRGAKAAGFATEMWSLRRVRDVIRREIGVSYSADSTVHAILHGLGFSPQLAVRRAREQRPEEVAHFRAVTWPALKKKPSVRGARSR